MISQEDIDAFKDEPPSQKKKDWEYDTWVNNQTDVAGKYNHIAEPAFMAGWDARKKADYEALYGMTPVLAQTVKHDCCLRFDDSPNAPYLVLAENRTSYRGWNLDVGPSTMMTEEEANTWQGIWEAHRTTICRQTTVHVVTDMDTPLPGLIL